MRVKKVKYISGYKLAVEFTDGAKKTLDLSGFLRQATNPMTTKYRDKNLFKQVTVQNGSLTWNGEMDIHALDIYKDVFVTDPSYV